MKLTQKLRAVSIPSIATGKRQAEKLFATAVNEEKTIKTAATTLKNLIVESALNFFESRQAFPHGEWEAHCALYAGKIDIRVIQRRIKYAKEWVIPYVILKSPDMKVISMREIRARAIKMEIPSTLEISETFRTHGIAIEYGQYHQEDYQRKRTAKLLAQTEFDFGATVETLGALCKQGLPNDVETAEALAKSARLIADHAERHLKSLKNTVEVK